jgi:acyl carrier protein
MDNPTASKVRTILIEDLGLGESLISDGKLLSKGGLDSFDRIRLVDLLQERFNVYIGWESVVPDNFDSVSTIVRLIAMIKAQSMEEACVEQQLQSDEGSPNE